MTAPTTTRPRVPEPMAMDDPAGVAAFHATHPILQAPIHRINALALSRLLPAGGTLLDLGSGSGRLLADLALARPDVRIIGRDIAPNMVAAGREELARLGLQDRVALEIGDMTQPGELPARVDVISCIWALHHLPSRDDALRCLTTIATVRSERGAAVWVFDFARLEADGAFAAVIDAVPGVGDQLRADALASERAAWTAGELRALLQESGLGDLTGGPEARIGHLQAWTSGPVASAGHDEHWRAAELEPPPAAELAARLEAGLPAAG